MHTLNERHKAGIEKYRNSTHGGELQKQGFCERKRKRMIIIITTQVICKPLQLDRILSIAVLLAYRDSQEFQCKPMEKTKNQDKTELQEKL